MAGSVIPMEVGVDGNGKDKSVVAIGDQWEVQYARFFSHYSMTQTVSPSSSSTTASSSNRSSLCPIKRRRHNTGTWLSSSASSNGTLYIFTDRSGYGSVLSVYFRGKLMEEHFIAKLHFTWPQVSCVSGFPTRGSLVVFVTYKDCMDEVQKFAVRFSTINDSNSFVKCLEDSLFRKKDVGSEPLPISSPSQHMTPYRPTDMSSMVAIDTTEILEMPPIDSSHAPTSLQMEVKQLTFFHNNFVTGLNSVADSPSNNFVNGLNSGAVLPAFPPRFASLLTDCYPQIEVEQAGNAVAVPSNASEEVAMKAQIEKYMQDASFLDILTKVEKVINELGGGGPILQAAGA
ncbi:hypothetical protein Dimus_015126 [Dionaea muscipula]